MLQLLTIMTMARDAARFCLNFVSCFFGVCVSLVDGGCLFFSVLMVLNMSLIKVIDTVIVPSRFLVSCQ